MQKKNIIDWKWVRNRLLKLEMIPLVGKSALFGAVNICLKEARALSRPRTVAIRKKIAAIKGSYVELEDEARLTGKVLAKYLKGADHIYIFLVTLGSGVEDRASRLMKKGNYLHGYLIDRIASLAVESLAENFESGLRQKLKPRGESVSMRLSPGYCDWPIEEQYKLAKLINFSKAGIRLTESCMMVPKKSISAIAATGQKKLFTRVRSQCVICDKKRVCDYRRDT